jgi:hypothetical protein
MGTFFRITILYLLSFLGLLSLGSGKEIGLY